MITNDSTLTVLLIWIKTLFVKTSQWGKNCLLKSSTVKTEYPHAKEAESLSHTINKN